MEALRIGAADRLNSRLGRVVGAVEDDKNSGGLLNDFAVGAARLAPRVEDRETLVNAASLPWRGRATMPAA